MAAEEYWIRGGVALNMDSLLLTASGVLLAIVLCVTVARFPLKRRKKPPAAPYPGRHRDVSPRP